jgi:hypothetical protein
MDYPQEQRSSFWPVLIVIIIIAILVVILIFALFREKKVEQKVEEKYTINIRARSDHANDVFNASYELYFGNVLKQEGTIYYGKVEQFVEALNWTNYTVKARADGYYDTEELCAYDRDCVLQFQKIGNVSFTTMRTGDQQVALVYKVVGGRLKNALMCYKWPMGLFDVKLKDKDFVPVPRRIEPFVDKCYSVGDMDEEKFYLFDVSYVLESGGGGAGGFDAWIVDECNTGYDLGCAPDIINPVSI